MKKKMGRRVEDGEEDMKEEKDGKGAGDGRRKCLFIDSEINADVR